MKTLILAAFAVLNLAIGGAFAQSLSHGAPSNPHHMADSN